MSAFATREHVCGVCVVGGGLAGVCAAISAARHGASVVIMQDRPMFGGNSSSEIRMCVSGARGSDNRETGLIEEFLLEDYYRNPDKIFQIWDGVLYAAVRYQEGVTMLLNCSCLDCEMSGSRVVSITGWQLTTQSYHRVKADIFIDCSGDSVLAPLTGAQFRYGREGRSEFGEDIAPETADRRTMGMSCLLETRESDKPSTFIPPDWAYRYTAEQLLPYRMPKLISGGMFHNFWWIELGGEADCIADTEELRDELLKIGYGVWDYVKNAPENVEKYKNWKLDWIGILPGKRESRRYVGDHLLNQNDVRAHNDPAFVFDDVVAYGGWPMDDHHPGGFHATSERPTIFHEAPSPFGIPYRCLYSVNIENLMFAGRNISVTHTALSSTRVAATCGTIGQAAGTAAAIAVEHGITPRALGQKYIAELQQTLLDDDCMLPNVKREVPALTLSARLESGAADAENLRNGFDRAYGETDNGCHIAPGQSVSYIFEAPRRVERVRIVFDSDLNRETLPSPLYKSYFCSRPVWLGEAYVPTTLTRSYRLEGKTPDGETVVIAEVKNNRRRLCLHEVGRTLSEIRLVPLEGWGKPDCHVFSFEVR